MSTERDSRAGRADDRRLIVQRDGRTVTITVTLGSEYEAIELYDESHASAREGLLDIRLDNGSRRRLIGGNE